MFLQRRLPALTAALVFNVASSRLSAQDPQIFQGDWVGEIRAAGSATFVRVNFAKDSIGPLAVVDMPSTQTWGIRARLATGAAEPVSLPRSSSNSLRFQFPFARDTAYFEGAATASSIDGSLRVDSVEGTLHLVHRMPYDSAFVRSLAGNYALAPDHIISIGPLDEAGGWLAFFDNKTLRAGILYALTDSTFFTGPSYGIDYPITMHASAQRDAAGHIDALVWRDSPSTSSARRSSDFIVEKDVSFKNGDVRLVGDLTIPNTRGPHPAVILIHGCCGSKPTRDFGRRISPITASPCSRTTGAAAVLPAVISTARLMTTSPGMS